MDGQEKITSTTSQNNTSHGPKRLLRIAFSTLVALACYLLIPIGLLVIAGELTSTAGILIPATLAIFAIWTLPTYIAATIYDLTWQAIQLDVQEIDTGWILGEITGLILLTGVWFLPLWAHLSPQLAGVLQLFRAAPMLDDPWLMGLSWIACIPIQLTSFSVVLGSNEDHTKKTEKQRAQSTRDRSQEKNQPIKRQEQGQHQNRNKEEMTDIQSDLTFGWESAPTTRFHDVGGMDDLKRNIMRSVLRPLSHTDAAYERFNVSPPNGILLHGPPGTGKTHFARAIAGELGHPYLELSAGDIKSRWVNESTEQVNQLFKEAEQFERCVIFVDEIDALLAGRGNDLHREHAQVVNEFLAHLDDEDPSFLLIAATNRADLLDEAATRRGRFDQQYEVDLPNEEAREKIFKVRLQALPTDLDQEEYQKLAEQSTDLSSADIVGIVDDAAMQAAERDAQAITYVDLTESFPESTTTG
ncbi:ATP-binding protein [Haladaptatus caseinilyticus]|uniref:ATP-binding protein n=1 Tax=Haladaptatus caseinilyticus TaxID=2993314 RepID=UPI00224A91F5|nr:ATP-binding protein [Haladaptatus caseinilyticus]